MRQVRERPSIASTPLFRKNLQTTLSSETIDTAFLDTDDDSHEIQDITDLEEDSTIVSSSRSLISGTEEQDGNDSSESTIDMALFPSELQNSSNFGTFSFNSDSSTDDACLVSTFCHQNSVRILADKPSKLAEDVDSSNSGLSYSDYYGRDETDELLPEPLCERNLDSLSDPDATKSHFKNKARRRMSLGEMETVLDTVFKSWKSMSDNYCTSRRRLSFGAAVEHRFDKAAPACDIAQDCLKRMDTWVKRTKSMSSDDDNMSKDGDIVNESNTASSSLNKRGTKKLKSILKFFPRFSRNGPRRASFFNAESPHAEAPKRPGRRASFSGNGESEEMCVQEKEIQWIPQEQHSEQLSPVVSRRRSRRGSFFALRRSNSSIDLHTMTTAKPDGRARAHTADGVQTHYVVKPIKDTKPEPRHRRRLYFG